MRRYDRASPFIFIHIPKAAGTSVRAVFRRWYGDGLHEQYADEVTGILPQKLHLQSLHDERQPVAVFGHFNRGRGFGYDQYYPEVRQFMTILRDPFERAVSAYYFLCTQGEGRRDTSSLPQGDLREFLRDMRGSMLNRFPRRVTRDNYREQIEEFFIEIGVAEHLAESLGRMAKKLDMPFSPEWLPHLNAAAREEYSPDLRAEFAEKRALEYEVYEYVAARYRAAAAPHVAS